MLDLPNIGWAVGVLLGLGAGFAGAVFANQEAGNTGRRRTFLRWTLVTSVIGGAAILTATVLNPCIFGPAAEATFIPTSLAVGLAFVAFNPDRAAA